VQRLDAALAKLEGRVGNVEREIANSQALQATMRTELEKLQHQVERLQSGSRASTSAAAGAAAAGSGSGGEGMVDETTIYADVLAEEIVKTEEKERCSKLTQLIETVAAERGMLVRLGGATAWQPRSGAQGSAAASIRFNISVPAGMRKDLLARVGRALQERGVLLRDRLTPAGLQLRKDRQPVFNFIRQQGGKAAWRNGADIKGSKHGSNPLLRGLSHQTPPLIDLVRGEDAVASARL
jgi:hypothetical protein